MDVRGTPERDASQEGSQHKEDEEAACVRGEGEGAGWLSRRGGAGVMQARPARAAGLHCSVTFSLLLMPRPQAATEELALPVAGSRRASRKTATPPPLRGKA